MPKQYVYLSAQAEEAPGPEVAPGVRPRRRAPRLSQRLEGLVGGEHAVHGEAIEHALHLCELPHRPEGLEGLALGVVEVEVCVAFFGVAAVAVVAGLAAGSWSTTASAPRLQVEYRCRLFV